MFKKRYTRGTMFSTSQLVSQSVSVWCIFLEHDLWVCPPRYDQIDHSAIPEDVCVGGWINGWVYKLHNTSGSVQNLTERKQCWLCSKPFLKKLHQLSSATHERSLCKEGGRECVWTAHRRTQRWGQTPIQRRVHTNIHVPVLLLLLQVFRECSKLWHFW